MRRTIAWVASIVAFAVVVGLVVLLGLRAAFGVEVAPAPAVAAAPEPLVALGPAEDADDGDGVDVPPELPGEVAAILDPAVAGPGMGNTVGVVSDAATGQVLWDGGAQTPATPASTTKILTAAAALLALDPEQTQPTRVLAGARPGEVVLQGTGDETLSASGDGAYTSAASMQDLADQVSRALGGQRVTTVLVDMSGAADTFHPSWDRMGLEDGYITPIEPVAVDAGRAAPDALPRSATPALDAGRVLAGQLGGARVAAAQQAPAADAQVLGEVRSAPLITRVNDMLVHSDNVMAEQIGREVAAATGRPATFRGAADAVLAVLADHGLLVDGGASLQDVSGLSPDNRIRPVQLDRVLRAAAGDATAPAPAEDSDADAGEVCAALSHLIDGLPVAAVSGTLADRYAAGNPGAGWVRAKTGTLDGVAALAGVVATEGGRVLTFTLLSNEADVAGARAGADSAIGAVRTLG